VHVIVGPDRFRVRTWSSSPVTEVRGRLDDGPCFQLDSSETGAWEAPLQGDRLTKGEHIFEVEVISGDGRLGRKRISFMVDPTGRYTAVPSVRPRVTQTSFC
jgi:3',5'-cyclic-AMP phosphodiesterase